MYTNFTQGDNNIKNYKTGHWIICKNDQIDKKIIELKDKIYKEDSQNGRYKVIYTIDIDNLDIQDYIRLTIYFNLVDN